jgi:hypothetical protein
MKEVSKVLTKEQRLEIENCVLKRVIDQVRRAADKLDEEASGDGIKGIAAINLKERLKNAIDYGDRLEREFVWAEYLLNFSPDMDWAEYLREGFPGDIMKRESLVTARSQEN